MANPLNTRFGTFRGLIRLGLSYVQTGLGLARVKRAQPHAVKRLVFVCHGNICRSAFADVAARMQGMNVASFGLSTSSGKGAHPPVIDAARAMGIDLSAHVTINVTDFVAQPGDLLLVMEVRQLGSLARHPELAAYPRALLGSYASPPVPHLHDPYKLDPEYMPVCLTRIASAVDGLIRAYPAARLSG